MAAVVERVDGNVGSLDSDAASARQNGSPLEQPDQNNPLLGLPIVAIETVLNFMTYDEISLLRSVCKRMDMICQRVLNQGFLKVERYHSLCQRQVKAQLPRRESERRNHSLARHADILAAVETRLSLLNMTFMKYVDSNLCCFIPGKVIDEIYRVLRYVNSTRAPQRAHEVLQELRDISSMAMEYFDEKIVPILKKKLTGADLSGRLIGSAPVAGPSTSLTTMSLLAKNTPSRSEMTKVQQQVKVNGASMTVLRREMQEVRVKQLEQQKQLQDQEQKLLEQTQVIGEQNARLAELEHKLRELMDSSSARPDSTIASTSNGASTSPAKKSGTAAAQAPPAGSEEDSSPSLKRTRKTSDFPRQSKRLRCKKGRVIGRLSQSAEAHQVERRDGTVSRNTVQEHCPNRPGHSSCTGFFNTEPKHGELGRPRGLRVGLHRAAARGPEEGDPGQAPGDQVPDGTGPAAEVDRVHDGGHPIPCLLPGEGPGLEVGLVLDLHLRQLHQPLHDSGHPRDLPQHGVREQPGHVEPLLRHVRQPARGPAVLGLLQALPPGPPQVPGRRRRGRGHPHRLRGLVLLHAPQEVRVDRPAAALLRRAPARHQPQARVLPGARQLLRPDLLQRAALLHVGRQAAGLHDGGLPAGHGSAPHLRSLYRRALHVPEGPRDLLLLRLPEPAHLQRGLPQRAPRLPQHPGAPPAHGEEDRSRVLRRPASVHVVGQGSVRLHHGRLDRAVLQSQEEAEGGRQAGVTPRPSIRLFAND